MPIKSTLNRCLSASFLLIVTFYLISPSPSYAAPAANFPYQIEQPDGFVFKAISRGDEWNNWVETVDGYTVAPHKSSGYWYYVDDYDENGTPKLSPYFADDPPPSGIPLRLAPPRKGRPEPAPETLKLNDNMLKVSPPIGAFNGSILYILVQFADRTAQTTEAQWASFITGSIADYYSKATYGKVNLVPANETFGTVNNGTVGWLTLNQNHPDPKGAQTPEANTAKQQLIKDAILAADPFVDFAAYDANQDKNLDADELSIVVIAAGFESSISGQNSPGVWGHAWCIFNVTAPVVDGVTTGDCNATVIANGYAAFGELMTADGINNVQSTLGIQVHELGHHTFGLPDLYDGDQSSPGIGNFGLMGGGSWGMTTTDTFPGQTPVMPSAWTRYKRGWADCPIANGAVSITASAAATATSANSCYRMPSNKANEYFMIENRQAVGYDAGFTRPDWQFGAGFGGLAIWHIDDTQQENNNNDQQRWVDLEEADGVPMAGMDSGQSTDLWYATNATTFSDGTTPNSKLYDGAASGVSVINISASGTVMNAQISSMTTPPPPNDSKITSLGNISTGSALDANGTKAGFIVTTAGRYVLLAEGNNGLDPVLELTGQYIDANGAVQSISQINDNWDLANGTEIQQIISRQPATTNDGALVLDLLEGIYSAKISAKNGATGRGIIAISQMVNSTTPARIRNISTNGPLPDANGMTAGFQTTQTGRYVILAEGNNGLNPILELTGQYLDANGAIQSLSQINDDWDQANSAEIQQIIGRLPKTQTDSALVLELPLGVYNAKIAGFEGATGSGIIQITQAKQP
ncbi:MAG: M6 family metalloprotease domain-containing protein [Candidatus Competibacteraceae bacterium]|nr:M6 family metalloprotease domain-containing protein [Candidatus Competibacteraceae bacterium]